MILISRKIFFLAPAGGRSDPNRKTRADGAPDYSSAACRRQGLMAAKREHIQICYKHLKYLPFLCHRGVVAKLSKIAQINGNTLRSLSSLQLMGIRLVFKIR
jgi:hypothetical protein